MPDKNIYPERYEIVMKNMVHGPCGDWCMKDGVCSKKFPKEFQNETTLDENGYPHYRRRNTGTYERNNGHEIDNRWVVPYCPELLDIFNCHINVEVVSSIKAVKYLYKYIYKGHDAANVVITDQQNGSTIEHNEVRNYIDSRYVGPVECCFRISSKELQDKSHSITRLSIHLPNEQCIIIPENPDEETTATALQNSSSMLLDYFKLNTINENAHQYFYSEIPTKFTYHKKTKNGGMEISSHWGPRKNNFNVFGRIYSVSPSQTELFHLRLLLLHVKGATSFDNLKTVNGVLHTTFTAACLALGLIEDDDEWNKAMEEGIQWMMPQRLRLLFVRILVHCQPVYPEKLWDDFKDAMSEDFSRTHEKSISYQMAYACISDLLVREGKSLADFPSMNQTVIITSNDEETFENRFEMGQTQYNQLNNEQKTVVDIVLSAARTENYEGPKCIWVQGQGGSGKTFMYQTIYNILSSENIKVCSTAFTGIASILLPNGKTLHKTFGLPVPTYHDSSSNIVAQSKEGQYLKEVKLFIWDEAPMAPRYALEIADRTLKSIMNNDLPFGGKIMVLGGDFRQLLPVKVNGTRNETLNLSIKYSNLWNHFSPFQLKTNMRVLPDEIEFAKFLTDENEFIKLPAVCILPRNECIVQNIFGNPIRQMMYDDMTQCAILSARNKDVDEINEQVTDLLNKSTERIYTGIDSLQNCDNGELMETIVPEYLNSLNPPSLPPYKLKLRKYCTVMLIRNISINEGLCNGTRLQIIDFSNHLLKCKVLTGDKRDTIVFLNRITLHCDNDYPFSFSRRQFPIKLAFAMTINKAQGQTFKKIGVDLRRDVFNHGQLYVAFSRVRSWDSLKVYLGNHRNDNLVKNHVYKEIYQ